jgi:TetR/AcrR family transcriptional repressor of mexJK operon
MSRPAEIPFADSHQRLIRAAAEAFREEGYRASIDRIAERAGVARQTVYNHFPCKEDLFSEVARNAANTILVSLDGDGGDVRERLLGFATALRQRVLGDEGLAMFRALSAEVPRLPALGQAFFDKGPGQTAHGLAAFLALAMEEGHLRRDDPLFAAETLMGMLYGFEHTRRLFCVSGPPLDTEQTKLAQIVDCFLRAFAPER